MTALASIFDELEDATANLGWHCDPKDKDPRSEIQRVTAFLRDARILCPAVDIQAIPNGARRSRWEAMQAKREGLKAGALDHVITWPGRGIAFIEWKNGVDMPSANQVDRLNLYVRQGHHCGVFRQEESAFAWLLRIGAPFIARLA